jgi:uncharacterized membrane protein YqiK
LDPNLITFLGIASIAIVAFIIAVTLVYRNLYVVVGPNEALVISGGPGASIIDDDGQRRRLGFRIVTGGGTLVNPIIERYEKLSLGLVPLELSLKSNSETVSALVRAQVKISCDEKVIRRAVEVFLGKGTTEIGAVVGEVLASRFEIESRSLEVDRSRDLPELLGKKLEDAARADLANIGIEIVSISISANLAQSYASS